jgi:hypothetical protein
MSTRNPANYTTDEIDALPTDVASWDKTRFAGANLTVKELREFKAANPKASVTPAYGMPQFRVGDLADYCHDGRAHRVSRVEWCPNSGCGHYSFWRVIVPGISDQQCNFSRVPGPVQDDGMGDDDRVSLAYQADDSDPMGLGGI